MDQFNPTDLVYIKTSRFSGIIDRIENGLAVVELCDSDREKSGADVQLTLIENLQYAEQ